MKNKKMLLIAVFCIVISGCSSKIGTDLQIDRNGAAQAQPQYESANIKVINSKTTLKRGDMGFITIKGLPSTKYEIKTSYKTGNHTVSVSQWRITDRNGEATFNWVVSPETTTCTCAAAITGGGSMLKLSHTIVK